MTEHQTLLKKITKLDFFILLPALILAMFVVVLGYTGRDDSHITYFVADILAAEGKIENYNGDRVEQSSSIFFVAALALFVKILDVPAALIGPYVSLLFLLATLPLAKSFATTKNCFWLPCLLPPVVYWSLSGMENSFYLFWLLLLIASINRHLTQAAPSKSRLILIVTTSFMATGARPEAVLIISCLGLSLFALLFYKPHRLPVLEVVLALALSVIAYVALKKTLGFELFPNPVYAKQKMDFYQRLSDSTRFLRQSALDIPMSTFIAMIMATLPAFHLLANLKKGIDISAFLCLSITGIVLSFDLLSGGDWMENGRFLVPCYFFTALAFINFIPQKLAPLTYCSFLVLFSIDILLISSKSYGGITLFDKYQFEPKNFKPAESEFHNVIHSRDISFTDKAMDILREDPRKKITIASVQAGLVPYYLFSSDLRKKLHFVDLYGLTTTDVHTCFARWADDPYQNIEFTQSCVNKKFDYIYDLDSEGWPRLLRLVAAGCSEVFKEHLQIEKKLWNKKVESYQFLVQCDN